MDARTFYFDKVAPLEKGRNYQQVYQGDLFAQTTDRVGSRILGHLPSTSNCCLLEEHIEKLAQFAPVSVRSRLQGVFVAKRRELEANAKALRDNGEYDGDLVYFYVGLSDLCFQYCIAFAELTKIRRLDLPEQDQGSLKRLCNYLERLGRAQERWLVLGDYIKLREEDVLRPTEEITTNLAVNIACATDRFILSHELAHHLLGHTGRKDSGSRYLQSLPVPCKKWTSADPSHAREFQADAFGLLLQGGVLEGLHTQEQELALIDSTLGALLTLTALAQSTSVRFICCLPTVKPTSTSASGDSGVSTI